MTSAVDLLPPQSGVFTKALATAMGDELPVPYHVIMDPYQSPVEFLPFLAAHASVDLWYEDWSEARKREMIAHCDGRSSLTDGKLADLKGTLAGVHAYLSFVDASLVVRVAHPQRFVIGRSAIGVKPVGHDAFTAHYVVRVDLDRPANCHQIGRSAIGRQALRVADREPIRRALAALRTAKAPETLYTVSFAWRRRITFGDALPLDGGFKFGGFIDRTRL